MDLISEKHEGRMKVGELIALLHGMKVDMSTVPPPEHLSQNSPSSE